MAIDAPFDISISRVPVSGRDGAEADTEVLVRLSGELDVSAEGVLVDRFATGLDGHRNVRVLVDLSEVSFVDSSGLRALLLCRQHAESLELPFELSVVDGPVTRLLALSGLDTYFGLRPSRASNGE